MQRQVLFFSTEIKAYIMALIAVIAFSLTLPITRYLTSYLSFWEIGMGRSLLAAGAGIALLVVLRQPFPNSSQIFRLCIIATGIAFGFPILTAVGMQSVPASHGGIILGGLPLATAIFGCALSGERPSLKFWGAAITGFLLIGTFSYVNYGGSEDLSVYKGDFALVGAVILAGLGYAMGGLVAKELGGWQVICWTLAVAFPLLVIITLLSNNYESFERLPPFAWLAFLFLSLVNSLVGFFLFYAALSMHDIFKISQVQLLQPFFTVVFAAMWLGETVTVTMYIFLLLTIAVVWFSKWA